ncbi:hypothetical protein XELAEV_18047979mg [Xenopus laevis]|uniref:Peptidase S1 domain-containing protein n=1 Tax=Xenopus laevis TaxID=8355 RepID=A0A974BWA0_XENLA|nr:hypothetical protein XELAEV_18047979mg [Xenopus laevis]
MNSFHLFPGLLLLDLESVSSTIYILLIYLPGPPVAFPPGTRCWTTGWGDVEFGGCQLRPTPCKKWKCTCDQWCKNAYFSDI